MNVTDLSSLTFYEVQTTLEKFGLHLGNIKFTTQNNIQINIRIIMHVILPVCPSIHCVQ